MTMLSRTKSAVSFLSAPDAHELILLVSALLTLQQRNTGEIL